MKKKLAVFCITIVASLLLVTAAKAGTIEDGPIKELFDAISKLGLQIDDLTKQHTSDISNIQVQLDAIGDGIEKTGCLNIPAAAFRVDSYGGRPPVTKGSDIYNPGSEGALLSAPVFLPHGATVTNVTLRASDRVIGHRLNQQAQIQLYRNNAGRQSALAFVGSVDGMWAFNFDDSIPESSATIDNLRNTYWLQLWLPADTHIVFHYAAIVYNYKT